MFVDYKTIRKIDPREFLGRLNIEWKSYGHYFLTYAIWRGEREPSVSFRQVCGDWVFVDHGSGLKGDIINYLELCGWSKEKINNFLSSYSRHETIYATRQTQQKKAKFKIWGDFFNSKVLQWVKLSNVEKNWWQERRILLKDLQKFKAQLLYYKRGNYIAFENVKQGYECFEFNLMQGCKKFSLVKKDICFWNYGKERVVVAESVLDCIALSKLLRGQYSFLSLNSAALVKKAAQFLVRLETQEVLLCLDNDDTGLQATKELARILANHNMQYKIIKLEGAKDPCEYLKNKCEYLKNKSPQLTLGALLPPWLSNPRKNPQQGGVYDYKTTR